MLGNISSGVTKVELVKSKQKYSKNFLRKLETEKAKILTNLKS